MFLLYNFPLSYQSFPKAISSECVHALDSDLLWWMAPIFLPLDYDHPQQSKRLGQSSHCNIQLAQQGWPNERRTCKSLGRSVFPKNNTPTNDQSANFAGFRPNDLILLYQSLASCKTLIDMANHGKISFQSGIYIPHFSFSQGSMGGVFGSQF